MRRVDLTVVLTAHDETLVSGPTLTAAELAIGRAEADGITVERIIALDRPSQACRNFFLQERLSHWQKITLDEGDLGRARNAVIPQTCGRHIAFLDADDLFSPDWLRAGVMRLRALEEWGIRAICHPELNWLFDGAHAVFLKPDQDDPLFLPQHFYFTNYYDSLCIAPREAHLEHPYIHRDIPAGLSFQDWQFSIETMEAGWQHVNAPGTIIFKRRRDESLVSESRTRRAVVRFQGAMRVDKVEGLSNHAGIDPDKVTSPDHAPTLPENPSPEPHYGPVFAARIERARNLQGNVADISLYHEIKSEFDHAFYLAQYPDIRALEEIDPVAHYIRAGWREGRDPAPWFGTNTYLERYPDVATSGENPFGHYLRTGRIEGRLAAPFSGLSDLAAALDMNPRQVEATWRARYDTLRARLEYGDLGEQVRASAAIEPLIEAGWSEALALKVPPLHSDPISARTAALLRLARRAEHRPARYVICVNRARFGGAKRIEGHLAHALARCASPEEVLVITTDKPGRLPAGKLPDGVRHVDFASLVDLKGDSRQRVLVEFLRALEPKAVFNINSRLLWEAMTPYGTALGADIRLYAGLLCNEQTDTGHAVGYALRRVYRHFDQLSGIFTDSHALADEIRERHMIPLDLSHKVQVLANPVDPQLPVVLPLPAQGRRPQLYWAGRMDAQKRVDLAYAIARALPECDLHIWGAQVMGGAPLPDQPENVIRHGRYEHFADLPLGACDLWVYTAAWDGVPVMLLEVAMSGLPVLACDVGGISEVLEAEYLLPPQAGATEWAQKIRVLLAHPQTARKQALIRRDRLIVERSEAAHEAALMALPGLADR